MTATYRDPTTQAFGGPEERLCPAPTSPASTVGGFLFGGGAEAERATLGAALAQSGVLAQAQSRLGSAAEGVWSGAHQELAAMASDFLSLDLAEVVLAGWRTCRELLDAAQATRHTGSAAVVPLGSRHLSLVQQPTIDLVLGSTTVPAIRFELRVDVEVIGVAGIVRDGALVALEGGLCDVAISFSAEGRCLAERKGRLDPRVSIPLGRGIQLGNGRR